MKCSEINIRDPYIVFCYEHSTKITKACYDELLG